MTRRNDPPLGDLKFGGSIVKILTLTSRKTWPYPLIEKAVSYKVLFCRSLGRDGGCNAGNLNG